MCNLFIAWRLRRMVAAQVYNNQFGPESHVEKALEALSS